LLARVGHQTRQGPLDEIKAIKRIALQQRNQKQRRNMMPKMRLYPMFSMALVVASGCAGASNEPLRARAASDLNCPADKIEIVTLDDSTQGVAGCGERRKYVENCGWHDGYGAKHDCRWSLNTDSTNAKRASSDTQSGQ
jgi:hypothetical protein